MSPLSPQIQVPSHCSAVTDVALELEPRLSLIANMWVDLLIFFLDSFLSGSEDFPWIMKSLLWDFNIQSNTQLSFISLSLMPRKYFDRNISQNALTCEHIFSHLRLFTRQNCYSPPSHSRTMANHSAVCQTRWNNSTL